jgi:hypothetical protein
MNIDLDADIGDEHFPVPIDFINNGDVTDSFDDPHMRGYTQDWHASQSMQTLPQQDATPSHIRGRYMLPTSASELTSPTIPLTLEDIGYQYSMTMNSRPNYQVGLGSHG